MIQQIDRRINRGGRIFPEYTIPTEELARRKALDQEFYQRCQAIFDRIYPQLVANHYDWAIMIEPDSGDYFLERDEEVAFQKARSLHPNARLMEMRLNETGTCGRI